MQAEVIERQKQQEDRICPDNNKNKKIKLL